MLNIAEEITKAREIGYEGADAEAKICQDIILMAIAKSRLNKNVTIKGGVVMRSKTGSVRRATQDVDLDFIKYSISDESIEKFVSIMNSAMDGISIKRKGKIEELKQQDYHGKRIFVEISDEYGTLIESKIDLGVHNRLEIDQEEYCFDIAFDKEGASLLINSKEQMFTEKLRGILRFGAFSGRLKDPYDMYYLCDNLDRTKLKSCIDSFILNDEEMREKNMDDVLRRVKRVFADSEFKRSVDTTERRWIDDDIETVFTGIVSCLEVISNS